MGAGQSNNSLLYYGTTLHPIVGEVTAFSIKNQASKFVMKNKIKVSPEQLSLFQKVGKENNPHLITYYGTEVNNVQKQKVQIKGQKDIQLYWQLLNYDLAKQIVHLRQKNQNILEDCLWQIMDSILKASIYLQKFNIYLDLSPKKIEFSAGREPKAYWADILPDNMHRGYQRFIHLEQFRHTVYAPQQLLQMNRKPRKQLNRQKCVMFSLGILLLQAASKIEVKQKIYNFAQKKISEAKKRQIMDTIWNVYSQQFWDVLCGLLEYFDKDRLDYKGLQHKINAHFGRKQEEEAREEMFQPSQQKQEQKTQKSSQKSKVQMKIV